MGARRALCIYLYNDMYCNMLLSALSKYSVLIMYLSENPVNIKKKKRFQLPYNPERITTSMLGFIFPMHIQTHMLT